MRRHKTWTKKLTAKEKKHIKESFENGRASKARIKEAIDLQQKEGIACYECRSIARKAGVLE
jgi:hypothetical protein